MSEVDARFVKRGLWTRIDEGSITGKTITADVQAGTIVVALLAVLASMGTAHLWNLVVFAVHQLRADGRPADGLFRQQQVLLRTLPNPGSLLADSTKLWLFWRKRVNRAFLRSLMPLLLGVAFWIGTIAVGVLSSYIVTGNGLQVLINSPLCGPLNIDTTTGDYFDNANALRPLEAKVVASSKSYADDCYQTNSLLPTRCGVFIQPYIPFTQKRTTCPFESSMCAEMEFPAMQFDSGLVDLNHGFGTNLGNDDRVKFRRSTTCAILDTASRTSVMSAAEFGTLDHAPFPGEELLLFNYGDIVYETSRPNATFVHSLAVSNITALYQQEYNTAYGNPAWSDMNDFAPLPEMEDPERDLVIIMLWKNSMGYGSPVNDPVFAAHDTYWVGTTGGQNETWYWSDSPASGIGCTKQYQFCFARKGLPDHCSDLSALPGKPNVTDYPGASDVQLAAIELLITSSMIYDISDAGQDLLKAKDLAGGTGYLNSLPDDQWIQEVTRWEAFVWASLQTAIIDYAVGPSVREPSAQAHTRNATTKGEKELCQALRVRKAGGFVTINAFGLLLIAVFSIIVAILDFTMLRFMITLGRFRRAMAPKIDRWIQDGAFQLQRKVYEAQGEGTWQHTDKEIPVTSDNLSLEDISSTASVWPSHAMQGRCFHCSVEKLQSMPTWSTGKTLADDKVLMKRDEDEVTKH